MSNQANQSCNPGTKAKEKNKEPRNDQFEKKQAQTQDKPEYFRSGKNVCDHNE
jgi:hypothetical protein